MAPDPETEELWLEQHAKREAEHERAEESFDPAEAAQHERRAQRAAYLEEKLAERGASEDESDG